MRVISGKYKRMELKGFNIDGIRPTMDKVKEAIFGMIQGYVDESVCLDLFAGTGSLGIEALSNDAKHVYFNDEMKDAINIIKTNIDKTNDKNSTIIHSDYTSTIKKFNENSIKFDIIFIDPSYGKIKIKTVIDKIIKFDILNEGGIIVCEYENETLDEEYDYLKLIKYRKYGKTYISIYKR